MLKNRSVLVSLFASALLMFFSAANVLADEAKLTVPRQPAWEIGIGLFHSDYEETDNGADSMSLKGLMGGFLVSYTHRAPYNNIMLKGELETGVGNVDYQSPKGGSMTDIDQSMGEFRGILGYDFYVNDSVVITAYTGFGIRYLSNASGGKTATSGAPGYDRESTYYYSPIGVEVASETKNGWALAFVAEYDVFWGGEQESQLGDAYFGAGVVKNEQDSGYGLRASVKIGNKKNLPFIIEPFFRYWNIDDSDSVNVPALGIPFMEPSNETMEIGVKLYIRF